MRGDVEIYQGADVASVGTGYDVEFVGEGEEEAAVGGVGMVGFESRC